MQALAWIFRVAIVLVLAWFALKNSQLVTVHGFPEQSWQAPLVLVVLVAFVVGVVIGLIAWAPTVVRLRREASRLRRAPQAPAADPPVTPPGADTHGV